MEYSVLVVDDEKDNIKLITNILKELGLGNKIYAAPNGKIALNIAQKKNISLILTDWEMPIMNGIELLKSLKQLPQTKDIPVIMITGKRLEDQALEFALETGAHDFIRKPFSKLELLARMKNSLNLQTAYLELRKSKDEIAKQTSIITKQHTELKELNKLKDKILSVISHDVRGPLNSLDGLLWILNNSSGSLDASIAKHFAQTQHKVQEVRAFLDNLLFWAKSQLESAELVRTQVNIHHSTQEVFNLFDDRAKSKHIDLINQLGQADMVYGDPNIIAFIIRNFIDNAIKFTPKHGQVTVSAQSTPDYLTIHVTDTGEGMEPQTIHSIIQALETKSLKGTEGEVGTGLGLKLCKDFLDTQHGKLSIESELGKGSIFKISLPNHN